MTRPRPGRATRLVATLGIAVLVGGCGATSTAPPSADGSPAASGAPSAPGPSAGGSDSASAAPSVGPDRSPSPAGSATPFATASASPRPGTADACTGTAKNRDFYSALATSVAWDVYCPVLPAGWFVDSGPNSGSYRLANGGQLSITYRGPDGARLVIREGSYCIGQPDCVPTGTDAGAARFGDRDARLLDLGNGSWLVVVVPAGADVDWQAVGTGMDGAALEAFTAAFARVDQ